MGRTLAYSAVLAASGLLVTASLAGTRDIGAIKRPASPGVNDSSLDIGAVERAETLPPVLSSPTGSATGLTTADIGATTDTGSGTLYGVVTTSSTTPSASQVKAGQNASGAAATFAGSVAVSSTGAKTIAATGLSSMTSYYAHLMHESAAGQSNVVTSAQFTTLGPATSYTLTGPTASVTGSASSNFTLTPNGVFTGTITPSDGGGGGTFTPASRTWTASSAAQTFTYTAASNGKHTISAADSGSLTDPASLVLVSGTVVLDAAILAGMTGPPYLLNTASAYYVLDADVTSNDSGFVFGAAGITLDFNGRTVTYNNAASIDPTNPGFETDAVAATTITGWTTSAAADVAAPAIIADSYLFGSKNLQVKCPAAKACTIATGNPPTVTCTGHGFSTGDRVLLSSLDTTPQLRAMFQTITVTGANTFTIDGANVTAVTTAAGLAAKAQTIATSGTTAIPAASRLYTATAAFTQPGSVQVYNKPCTINLRVFDGSTLLKESQDTAATADIPTGGNFTGGGFNATGGKVTFFPATTPSVTLKIELAAQTANTTEVHLDHVRFTRSYDYGVVACGEFQVAGYSNWSSAIKSAFRSVSAPVITDTRGGGSITQGTNAGCCCSAILCQTTQSAVTAAGGSSTERLGISLNGDDAKAVDGFYNTTVGSPSLTLRDIDITCVGSSSQDVISRLNFGAVVDLPSRIGAVTVQRVNLTNGHGGGIRVTMQASQPGPLIDSCDVNLDAHVSNSYAIGIGANSDGVVSNNTVSGYGRGIGVDPQGPIDYYRMVIEGNTLGTAASPLKEKTDREYAGVYGGRAFRMRNTSSGDNTGTFVDCVVRNNTACVATDDTSGKVAEAGKVAIWKNTGVATIPSGNQFYGNTWKAMTLTTDAAYSATGLIVDEMNYPGAVTFTDETIETNGLAFKLDSDDSGPSAGVGGAGGVNGIVFTNFLLKKATDGDTTRTFVPVQYGYGTETCAGNQLIAFHKVVGGVTSPITSADVTWQGSGNKDLTLGWLYDVTVQNAGTTPISGATVTSKNAANATDDTATTDGSGLAADVVILADLYEETGGDPASITHTALGPHTLVTSKAGYTSDTTSIGSATDDGTQTVHLTAAANNPQQPRLGIGLGIGIGSLTPYRERDALRAKRFGRYVSLAP